MQLKKIFLFLFITAHTIRIANAQCGHYINYVSCNDSVGQIYFYGSQCCNNFMAIWSTGDTGDVITVPPGVYWAQQYCDSIYWCTDSLIVMYHDTWQLTVNFAYLGTLAFYAYLPYCGTSIFTHPSCAPTFPGNQNILIVWQDGAPVDTLYNVHCTGGTIMWPYAQPGHCYDISICDTTCSCYQVTWMYNPPGTYCYPIITGSEDLSQQHEGNLNYTIINTFGQVIETGKFSGDIFLREKNFSTLPQSGIYYVIYSDVLDNKQVFTDKIFVSGR